MRCVKAEEGRREGESQSKKKKKTTIDQLFSWQFFLHLPRLCDDFVLFQLIEKFWRIKYYLFPY